MYTIVGLGNPGRKYAGTRHNIGFEVLDYIVADLRCSFRAGKGDYTYADYRVGTSEIWLVKPTTYMNNSGNAVRQLVDYFSVELERILIVCDDFNLPFGTFRFRPAGSDGGHNGLQSVIYELKTDAIQRLRVGIGNPATDAIDFVLSKFSRGEKEEIKRLLPVAREAILTWVEKGMPFTMNAYNRSFLSPSETEEVH
jgi:peptidyl-tRNA hydrolase, PTH1 family